MSEDLKKAVLSLARNASAIAEESGESSVEAALARGWQCKYEQQFLELKYGLVNYHTDILPKIRKYLNHTTNNFIGPLEAHTLWLKEEAEKIIFGGLDNDL